MALLGTWVNALAIIAGSLLGLFLPRMPEGIKTTVMQGIGLSLVILGVSMALKSSDFLILVASLVIGGVAGELLKVEAWLHKLGLWLEKGVNGLGRLRPFRATWEKSEGKVAAGFVTTTLIYCVGAMAILGAMDSGLRGDHQVLYMKSMLDGFSSIIFASTLGVGVMFSSIPILLYQGAIALSATAIAGTIDQEMLSGMIVQVTAVGGALIIGIGINILELKRISIANLLPSVFIAAMSVPLLAWINSLT
jgi:uncharacterized membrane protein YqgA involved in biofilm formation